MIDEHVARLASQVVMHANQAARVLEAHRAVSQGNAAIARSQAARERERLTTEARDEFHAALAAGQEHLMSVVAQLSPGAILSRRMHPSTNSDA